MQDDLKREPYTPRSTQYDLSEEEFYEEVAIAGQYPELGSIPPVEPFLGEFIPAGSERMPRALNRAMRTTEGDTLRNHRCPDYGRCLQEADRALDKPKLRQYEDAVTFVCDKTCPKRTASDVSSFGQLSHGFLAFMESDKKSIPPQG